MPVTVKTPKKSCLGCVKMLSVADQQKNLGRDFGAPICGTFLKLITRPDVNNNFPEKQAASCKEFSVDRREKIQIKETARREAIEIPVAMPFFKTDLDEKDVDSGNTISSCTGCRFYVPRNEMISKHGINSGFCRAKGSLLLDDRLWQYSKDCEDRTLKTLESNTRVGNAPIIWLTEYTDGYGKLNPATLLRRLREGIDEDPVTAKPDREGSDEAKKNGIRGWRKVSDQKGKGPDLYLPMFDISYFGEKEIEVNGHKVPNPIRSSIPRTGDEEHPEEYLDHGNFVYRVAVMWMRLKETPAIWGPGGVGKTELFRHLAWMMAMPFTRISITESSEIDDIAGKMMYTPEKGTYFHYGRIPQAWQRANVLCIDEPNTGPPAVWQFIRPLTDNSKQLVLDQNVGERIAAHKFTFMGMAMNPAWDPRNVGTQVIGDADGSRLLHIEMGMPPAEIEAEIIARTLQLDRWQSEEIKPVVDTVMAIAKDIRGLSTDGMIDTSWGIRHQKKVARVKRYTSWTDAYLLGVGDSLEPQQRAAILDVVKSHVADDE